jgi:ribosomal protein S18 acetylase RimI-like enzyme
MIFRRKRRQETPPTGSTQPAIRRYQSRDLDAIKRITVAAFDGVCVEQNIERTFGALAGTAWQQRRCSQIEQDLTYWPDFAFVAELNGQVVGYITTSLDKTSRAGHIRNVAVAPEDQGKGIGRSLLEHVMQFFREQGMQYARIETLTQNERCKEFYPSLGFREVAGQVLYFRNLD